MDPEEKRSMLRFRSFKAEIFFTIPVNALAIALVCAAFVTEEWVSDFDAK